MLFKSLTETDRLKSLTTRGHVSVLLTGVMGTLGITCVFQIDSGFGRIRVPEDCVLLLAGKIPVCAALDARTGGGVAREGHVEGGYALDAG